MNHNQNGLQLKKKTQNLSASHSDTRGTDGSNSQQIDWRWNVKVVSLALQVGRRRWQVCEVGRERINRTK